MKSYQISQRHSKERGQSLVEMALGLIVIVILFSGLVDVGRAYYIYVAMEDSVGEAALYLSINPKCWQPTDDPTCTDPNNGMYRARNANSGVINFDIAEYDITPALAAGRDSVGDRVIVEVRYPIELITPILSQIAGPDGITLSASASQLIITEYVP